MESLFTNIFEDDDVLAGFYEQFFSCTANQWSVRLNEIADRFIIEPRRSIGFDGPALLKVKECDDFILRNILKYLETIRASGLDSSLQKHQNIAFQALLRQFSMFFKCDYDQKSLESKYTEQVDEGPNNESDTETEGDEEEEDEDIGNLIVPTGSFFEGFSSPYEFQGIGFVYGSDCDYMIFPKYFTGTDDLGQTSNHFFKINYLSENIGYVAIEANLDYYNSLVMNNTPTGWLPPLVTEKEGKTFTLDSLEIKKHLFCKNESHGPALMVTDEGRDKREKARVFRDCVCCLYVPIWPKSTHSWISRERFHGWPSIATINKIVSKGCHVVPIGVPSKNGRGPQWRLSFSLAEIELAHSLEESMISVYGLFKYLMKNELTKQLDVKSYYLKNLFFWACEEKPQEFWTRENIAICLIYLMEKLEECLKRGELPQYFLPENNLFNFEEPQILVRNAEIVNGMKSNPFVFAPIFLIPHIVNVGLNNILAPSLPDNL